MSDIADYDPPSQFPGADSHVELHGPTHGSTHNSSDLPFVTDAPAQFTADPSSF